MDNILSKENLNLLKELAIASFKLRNEGSILGVFWYLLNPALMLGVLYTIFSHNIGSTINNYALFALIGIIQWNFFSASTFDGMMSIHKYRELIKKINFPKYLLVVSTVLNIFLSHLIEYIILFMIIVVFLGLSVAIIVWPIIILMQLMLSIIVSLMLAAFFTYYRDIQNIWKNILFIGWFLTPIFYVREIVPHNFSFILTINPLTHIIYFTRQMFLEKTFPNVMELAAMFFILLVMLLISYFIFSKLIKNAAERL